MLSITHAIGSSRMPRSRRRTSTPQASWATPSMTKESPIVAISRVSSVWLTSGRSTKRSVTIPTATISAMVTGSAAQEGEPELHEADEAQHGEEHHRALREVEDRRGLVD